MNTLALQNVRSRISKGKWKKEKCPCGSKGCRSWNVIPITYGQGIIANEADAEIMEMAPDLLDEVLELRELIDLEQIDHKHALTEADRLRMQHLRANMLLREEQSCSTCGHRECANLLDQELQVLKSCVDWRKNTGKALFRYQRSGLEESMKTLIDVECLDDIPFESDYAKLPLTCRHYGFDERTHWDTYMVLDANDFTIGFSNRMLKTREELAQEK